MGTRSLTHVVENDVILCTIYRQFDGYPTGHGEDLKRILSARKQVNGISGDATVVFNGMGCLAAGLIALLKTDKSGVVSAGNIYIEPAGATDLGEEFVYTISGNTQNPEKGISLKVTVPERTYTFYDPPKHYPEKVLFDGPVTDFNPEAAEKLAYADE